MSEKMKRVTFDSKFVPVLAPFAEDRTSWGTSAVAGRLYVEPDESGGAHLIATNGYQVCIARDESAVAEDGALAVRLDAEFVAACCRKRVSVGLEEGQSEVELPEQWQPGRVVAFGDKPGDGDSGLTILLVEPRGKRDDGEIGIYHGSEILTGPALKSELKLVESCEVPKWRHIRDSWEAKPGPILLNAELLAALELLGESLLEAGEAGGGERRGACLRVESGWLDGVVAYVMGLRKDGEPAG